MNILTTENPIVAAQEMQKVIDFATPEEAIILGLQGAQALSCAKEVLGSRHLIITALTAYIIDRDLVIDERERVMQAPATIQGYFAGIKFYDRSTPPCIRSLVVDLFDVEFVRSDYFPNPPQKTFREPFVIPVGSITSILIHH